MLLIVLCSLIALTVTFFIRKRQKHFSIFSEKGIPGPPPSLLFGNLWDVYIHGHLTMQKKWHEKYGPFVGYYLGYNPILLIADGDTLKSILLKDFHSFVDRSKMFAGPNGGFLKSLTVLTGQRWKDVRSTLTPSFTSLKLKHLNNEVCHVVDDFMRNVDKDVKAGKECDLYELYQGLTLDTICRTGMGVDFKIQKDIENSKILKQIKILFSFGFSLMAIVFMSFPVFAQLFARTINTLRLKARNDGEDPVAVIKEQCEQVLKFRRANPESRRTDLLQLMIDAQVTEAPTNINSLIAGEEAEATQVKSECPVAGKSKGLTDREIIDNAFLILAAGYETTSSSLAFITRMLLRFPEVQEKLRQELLAATEGGTVFDFDKLQKCQYLESVISEVLRMYPPIYSFTTRHSYEEHAYEKITIPKNISIFVSTRQLHYDEEVFPQPYEFRPERFLPENKTPAMSFNWQPFGAGPRNCIGMRFAQMEMKIALAKLLTKYKIHSDREPLNSPLIDVKTLGPAVQQVKTPIICKLTPVNKP